ncbi:hypothetical protein BU23DRAFT_594792 [Bimuria novae-zelandiae CBS 107.79]|uniref:Uncharacterized protein n=1 Tax=Bimuria novae-zelandiae CBS 107.79 TaxID=1447943 RepID=A0A6A5VRL3_9PLEO|nr:hypothetical protein BU23DRAFT_594792 [Bimuria novae-zelandiae CBS 107.79]
MAKAKRDTERRKNAESARTERTLKAHVTTDASSKTTIVRQRRKRRASTLALQDSGSCVPLAAKYPRVTFMDLPTEKSSTKVDRSSPGPRAKVSIPTIPILCANPKWSGMCKDDERCTYRVKKPPTPVGFWALAACCKLIRRECWEYFMGATVYSIRADLVLHWLNYLKEKFPNSLSHIKKSTLEGGLVGSEDFFTDYDRGNPPADTDLGEIKMLVPALEAIAVQRYETLYNFKLTDIDAPSWTEPVDIGGWDAQSRMVNYRIRPSQGTRLLRWFNRDFGSHVAITVETTVLAEWEFLSKAWVNPKGTDENVSGRSKEHQAVICFSRKPLAAEEADQESTQVHKPESEREIEVSVFGPKEVARQGAQASWRIWWDFKFVRY